MLAPVAERAVRRQGDITTVKRMDNVGIVVEDVHAALSSSGLPTLDVRMKSQGIGMSRHGRWY